MAVCSADENLKRDQKRVIQILGVIFSFFFILRQQNVQAQIRCYYLLHQFVLIYQIAALILNTFLQFSYYLKSYMTQNNPLGQLCYYEVLSIEKTATSDQIKQSYKKLALKYHPDKNQDKEMAKLKFHQLSQAYSVLNDPKKKQKYDKFGVRDSQQNQLNQFEQFMGGDFQIFQSFIDEMLNFDQMDKMLSEMMKMGGKTGGKKKKGGRAKGKSAGKGFGKSMGGMGGVFEFGQMNDMLQDAIADTLFGGMGFGDMSQEQLNELMKDPQFKAMMQQQGLSKQQILQVMCSTSKPQGKSKKSSNKQQQWQQDQQEQQLTAEQLEYLQFGNMHIQKKKNKKKKKIITCKFDQQKLKQEQILMHFQQKHSKQHINWVNNGKKPLQIQVKNASQKQQEEK